MIFHNMQYLCAIKQTDMFQSKQLGKRTKSGYVSALLGATLISPNGAEYGLVDVEIVGKKPVYIYKWINCPDAMRSIISDRLKSKILLSSTDIDRWVNELKYASKLNEQ